MQEKEKKKNFSRSHERHAMLHATCTWPRDLRCNSTISLRRRIFSPPFPSSLSSWLHAAGRGTTRDRRLILSRVNRRDRFRVPARREAAARYWPRFFHVLHASVQTPGDWKVGGRWRKWNRVDFSPSLSLFASPLLLKLQIFLFDQSGRNSLILLEKLIVKRHLFKNVFHWFFYWKSILFLSILKIRRKQSFFCL